MIKDARKIEFDFSEFAFAVFELISLIIVAMMEPGPATLTEAWTVFIHTYAMVQTPLGIVVRQSTYVVHSYTVSQCQAVKGKIPPVRRNR